jgi:hypothetical protein
MLPSLRAENQTEILKYRMAIRGSRSFAEGAGQAERLDSVPVFPLVSRKMTVHFRCFAMVIVIFHSIGWIIFAMVCGLELSGADLPAPQPASAPGAETNAALVRVGPGLFQIGEVHLDKNRRTIRFPAVVNLRDGNIEYVVVAATGKTHESIFKTDAQPYHVQLALLLLGARGATNALPEDPAKPLPGSTVVIEVGWTNGGRAQSFRAEEFVEDRRRGMAMTTGDWVYTGSRIREDGFAAQVDGSIVSLITDSDALVNNPRPGREDDDNWRVRTNRLPASGASVEVTIQLDYARVGPEKTVR